MGTGWNNSFSSHFQISFSFQWDSTVNGNYCSPSSRLFKENRYTFRGSNSIIFHCCLPYKLGSSHKKRICSHWSKFFPLRVDPFLGRLRPPGKQTGSHENYLPLKTCRKKWRYTHTNFCKKDLVIQGIKRTALKIWQNTELFTLFQITI